MKVNKILLSTLTLSMLAVGIHTPFAHASYTSYAHPYNALNSYITLGHFHMANNGNYSVKPGYYHNHTVNPNRHLYAIGGNWKDNYRPYAQLQDGKAGSNPQSTVIKLNGTTFIAYDENNDDTGTRTRIVKYNNINRTKSGFLSSPHYGPVFHGGHGQALAWNPKTNQLWLEYNIGGQGSRNNVALQLINQRTLRPMHQVKFGFEPYPFGAVLAFDNKGNAYNAVDTFSNPSGEGAPTGSLKIYKGTVNKYGAHFHMVQGLRHYPGAVMQNMSYNPANNRLYFLADGNYLSVPVNKVGNGLRGYQVHSTKLNSHYEPEDLAFYRGHGYLLLHYPSQLMINQYPNHARKHLSKRSHKQSKRAKINHYSKDLVRRKVQYNNARRHHWNTWRKKLVKIINHETRIINKLSY